MTEQQHVHEWRVDLSKPTLDVHPPARTYICDCGASVVTTGDPRDYYADSDEFQRWREAQKQ